MRVQHEKRSGTERRHYDLASLTYVEVEQRSGEDRRAPRSKYDIDDPKNAPANAFLIAATNKARNKR